MLGSTSQCSCLPQARIGPTQRKEARRNERQSGQRKEVRRKAGNWGERISVREACACLQLIEVERGAILHQTDLLSGLCNHRVLVFLALFGAEPSSAHGSQAKRQANAEPKFLLFQKVHSLCRRPRHVFRCERILASARSVHESTWSNDFSRLFII